MKLDRKTSQTTVKMAPALRNEIDKAAEALGISAMEFIRRACAEKTAQTVGGDERVKDIVP